MTHSSVTNRQFLFLVPVEPHTTGRRQQLDFEILTSYVRRQGFIVLLSEIRCDKDFESSLAQLTSSARPVAILWYIVNRNAFRLLKAVHLPIVSDVFQAATGRFASCNDLAVIREIPAISCVIRGEAERSVSQLLHCLTGSGDWKALPGISFKQDEEYIRAGSPALMEDLSALPFAADDLFDSDRMINGQEVLCSRGCNDSCTYCGLHVPYKLEFPDRGVFWRSRNAIDIADEIEWYKRNRGVTVYKLNSFVFFGYDGFASESVTQLAREILRRNLQISFSIVADAGAVKRNKDLIPLLKESGLTLVRLGLDSPISRQLKLYGVSFSTEDQDEALKILNAHRVDFIPSMIFYDPYADLADLEAFATTLLRWRPFFSHMGTPYWYLIVKYVLTTSLHIEAELPIASQLRSDNLLIESNQSAERPSACFLDSGTARLQKLHDYLVRRCIIPRLRESINCGVPIVDEWLNTFPIEALRQLIRTLRSSPELSDAQVRERLRTWCVVSNALDATKLSRAVDNERDSLGYRF